MAQVGKQKTGGTRGGKDPPRASPSRVGSSFPRIQAVSLDAGGMYGLTQAIWLRELCKRDPYFLDGTDPENTYFVGSSAGGMTAPLLAKQEVPRAFILAGKLEEFWKSDGIYTNEKNRTDRWLSNVFLSAWLGTEDYLECCREWMGKDTLLKDLKHRVVISTFNWHGKDTIEFPRSTGGYGPLFDLLLRKSGVLKKGGFLQRNEMVRWLLGDSADRGLEPSHEAAPSEWGPKLFCNFARHRLQFGKKSGSGQTHSSYHDHEDPGDGEQLVSDIAFACAAMPSIRAVRGGVGDGGIYSPSPAVDGIAAIIQHHTAKHETMPAGLDPEKNPYGWLAKFLELSLQHEVEQGDREAETTALTAEFQVLRSLAMLSVGDGTISPSYFARDFDFGMLPWLLLPVNAAQSGSLSPMSFQGSQIIGDITQAAEAILHGHFYRLDPGVNSIPIGPAVFLVRNRMLRELMIQRVTEAASSKKAEEALAGAASFVWSRKWRRQGQNTKAKLDESVR